MNQYIEEYIRNFVIRQNDGALPEQQNLFKEKDYYELLKPVLELINSHPDYSFEEYRNSLYELSGIEAKVKDFIFTLAFAYNNSKINI